MGLRVVFDEGGHALGAPALEGVGPVADVAGTAGAGRLVEADGAGEGRVGLQRVGRLDGDVLAPAGGVLGDVDPLVELRPGVAAQDVDRLHHGICRPYHFG